MPNDLLIAFKFEQNLTNAQFDIKLVKLSARRAIKIWIFKQEPDDSKRNRNRKTNTVCALYVYGSQCIVYCIVSEFQYLKPIISKRLHTHSRRFILSDLSKQSAQRLITSRSLVTIWGPSPTPSPSQAERRRNARADAWVSDSVLCTTWRLFMKHLA